MNEDDVLIDVKKAVALYEDKTFTADDLAARLKQIIFENNVAGLLHKSRLEKLLFKTRHLLDKQFRYYKGDKSLLGTCKTLEKELTEFVNRMLAQGYNIEGMGQKNEQQHLFK